MGRRGGRSDGGASADESGKGRAWTVVTFADLEGWRQRHGLPKKRVADLLGVTNSTYHNWARGMAVATPATQHKIHDLINGGSVPTARPAAGLLQGGSGGNGADGQAVLTSTAQIVNAYVQRVGTDRMTPDDLCKLIRDVSRALTS